MDISMEPERVLCRIAEVVYYCHGMGYRHVGLAFCTDLFSEARTIANLLRRFFTVTPVCCKIGGLNDRQIEIAEDHSQILCNPVGMARLLNKARTNINIMMGLCIGCDSVFMQLSQAPVTALFVKDRLLANNPIGAVYSKYQQESILDKL